MTTALEQTAKHHRDSDACLLRRCHQLGDFIFQLVVEDNTSFDRKLWPVLGWYRRVIGWQLNGEQASAMDFEHLLAFWVLAISVFGEHVENLANKQNQGVALTSRDVATSRYLSGALRLFEKVAFELVQKYPIPNLERNLAKRLFFACHTNIPKSELLTIAADIGITRGICALLAEGQGAAA